MTKITFSKELFIKVFQNCNQLSDDTIEDIEESQINLKLIEDFIDSKLSIYSSKSILNESPTDLSGRLGPKVVIFDVCSNIGSLVIESDRLSLLSHSGFSSIKANVCVFRGKWQYEVMLNSKGVMQMGWATKNCHFSQEKGVGDTNDSYAYDGNRVRKWNVSNSKYGQNWQIGDCITCAIDLDMGTVDFYRNGHHLGTAYKNVRIGKSYAYFPAVSLAYQESIVANFGSTPLKFPVEGYQPLELRPNDLVTTGALINEWICNLIAFDSYKELSINQYLICNKIFSKFTHIFCNKYVIEECFLKSFMEMSSVAIHSILDLMSTLMEDQQIHDFLEMLIRSIVNIFRFSPITTLRSHGINVLDFGIQKQCLSVLLSLVTHTQTRLYLLSHILFESKFLLILDIKSLEDESLTSLIFEDLKIENILKEVSINQMRDIGIESAISEVEAIQDMILSALIFQDELSRTTFVNKFDNFVRETVISNSRSQISHHIVANLCPVVLSVFQRLTYLIRNHLKDAINFIGVTYFIETGSSTEGPRFNQSTSNDSTRIGGTASYLQKQNKDELSRYMERSISLSPMMKDIYKIVDNLIKVYPMGAHKHLAKICSISDHLIEYIKTYKELKLRLETETLKTNEENLRQTLSVLEERIVCFSRQLILINSIELNSQKRQSIYWLLRFVINTLDHSSSCGQLFSFIPDYFIETLISLFSSIRFYFTIPTEEDSKLEYESLLQQFSSFIASHFCDQRITIAEIKDNLSQALASLVSNPETLKALESISFEKRIILVKSLCKPYENRAWAQTNWTMLRFWKGSGFGYRYSKPPNSTEKLGHPINKDQNSLNNLSPNPSILYQSLIGEYLKSEPKCGTSFLSSLLSQLNWTFSEFIGMLQEIQNSVNRPQKVFIDLRQLKICSTCFELTLALLRVLEMIVCVNPELITLSPPNEMIAIQLSQLLCQILNRLTITGCFDFVIGLEIQELDTISHFQILAAVSGILIALTLKGSQESRELAIRYITRDASFLVESLLFLIGSTDDSDLEKKFSLTDFEELNEEEKSALKQMVAILSLQYKLWSENKELSDSHDIPDDQICTICYANRKVALFSCGHQSCRSCIAIHFLRNGENCFFCKAMIERVVFEDSDQILYPKSSN